MEVTKGTAEKVLNTKPREGEGSFVITSSHGELIVGIETGAVKSRTRDCNCRDRECVISIMLVADIEEWKKKYPTETLEEVGSGDVLDFGYWYAKEDAEFGVGYETPEESWRKELAAARGEGRTAAL